MNVITSYREFSNTFFYVCLQIPEVLLWAKEQNEEKSPNLTQFTEHFNNMSYWYDALILKLA